MFKDIKVKSENMGKEQEIKKNYCGNLLKK